MFQIEVPMFPLILVTIGGEIVKKWQHLKKSKMAAAAILKNKREMNS